MKTKLIGCASTMDEVKRLAGERRDIDCQFLEFEYHAKPDALQKKLQEVILSSRGYKLITLVYGRCSRAVIGLCSPHAPLLFPVVDDCIGLLLGSSQKHHETLKNDPAVYFFSRGWLDYGMTPLEEYSIYEKKYGPKRAKSFIDTLYGRYHTAIFIADPGMEKVAEYRARVQEVAGFLGWKVKEIPCDLRLLDALVCGAPVPGTLLVKPQTTVTESMLLNIGGNKPDHYLE